MIALTRFEQKDFDRLIAWIDNKELLITIAGNVWSFPLTADQLQTYLDDIKSTSFNIVETSSEIVVGHAEIIFNNDGTCKIDKLLIDPTFRGKGFCPAAIYELLSYAFTNLPVHTVELNVFDWNTAGLRCYERSGFKFNPDKQQRFRVNDETWVTLNMTIPREQFLSTNRK
jgi:RimJ/RimL family protein N-acetyltransferase